MSDDPLSAWWRARRTPRVRASRLRLNAATAGLPARARSTPFLQVGQPRVEVPPAGVLRPTADTPPADTLSTGAPWQFARVLDAQRVAEGPLGSIDLSWRVLRDGWAPPMSGAPPRREVNQGEDEAADDGRPTVTAGLRTPLWKRLAYLLRPPAALLLDARGPLEWPGVLFPYQIDGVGALLASDALLLADDMGLGKTVQAIAALRVLVLQRAVEAALLVVPAGLVGQWQRQLRAWAPELRVSTVRGPASERAWQWLASAHVYLTSYETLREDFTPNPQAPPRRRTWDVVVLDEAQRLKGRDTHVSRVCKQLPRRRAWALSGTPLENSLDELASLLEFVTPYRAGAPLPRLFPGLETRERQQQVQLRRRKLDVLPQLPPKLESQVTLSLTGVQRASYERAEREGVYALRERGADVRIETVLELVTRLKQLCNVDPISGQSAKLADLTQRLATLTAEGHRALVFTQFTDATFGARALASRLTSFNPLVYTGDLPAGQREAVIHTFKTDPRHAVLILSLRAGGLGLNLPEASYVFHFDRWWNPAVERQAEDRSHRLGQMLPVHVYSYTCEHTIEERIQAVLRHKQRLFADIVDAVSLDVGGDAPARLSRTELLGLFGLAPVSS